MASSLTSLSVNKSNTRFLPTVKPRPNRKPAAQSEAPQKPTWVVSTTAPVVNTTEVGSVSIEIENTPRPVATPLPPAVGSTLVLVEAVDKGKAPMISTVPIIKPIIDKGKAPAVSPSASAPSQSNSTPVPSSSKSTAALAPIKTAAEKPKKAQPNPRIPKSKSVAISVPSSGDGSTPTLTPTPTPIPIPVPTPTPTPTPSSSKLTPPPASSAISADKRKKAKPRTSRIPQKKPTTISVPSNDDPVSAISLTTPRRRGKPISAPSNDEPSTSTAPEDDASSVASSAAGPRCRKRKEREPESLLTLEDVPNPVRPEYLDRPISDFTRDLGEGVVSKTYKEFEEARLKKRKETVEIIKNVVEVTEGREMEIEEEAESPPPSPSSSSSSSSASSSKGKRKAKENGKRSVNGEGSVEKPAVKENAFAPQVRIVNGKIVVDEESLLVDRTAMINEEDMSPMEYVEETAMTKVVNSNTYSKRIRAPRWTDDETELFYEALSQWGTDFDIISRMFPTRSRRQVKAKYNKEDKNKRWRVQEALVHSRRAPDMARYIELTGKTFMENPPIDDVMLDELEEARQEERTKAKVASGGAHEESDEEIVGMIDDEEEIVGMIDDY